MSIELSARRIRIAGDVSRMDSPLDIMTGKTPRSWLGNAVSFEFSVFFNSQIMLLSNIASAVFVVRPSQTSSSEYIRKTILPADFDLSTDATTWADKTKQQIKIDLTNDETNFSLGTESSKAIWFCLALITNDAVPREITVAAGAWNIVNDGNGNAGTIIENVPAYMAAADAAALYVPRHEDQAWVRFYNGRWYHYIQSTDLWYPEVAEIRDGVATLTLGTGVSL